MNVVWIAIASVALARIQNRKLLVSLMLVFALSNIYKILNVSVNASGYIQRKQIVEFIKSDAQLHGYPCVAVSYITSPGNELGYRYLFYLQKIHVNQPKSGSPVYTIVFPHSLVSGIDKSFGSLGLVLPDYTRYNNETVKQSCSGANSNLTDPLFGFTQ